jgi:hypothetical protein
MSTCRSHDLTAFSAPTGVLNAGQPVGALLADPLEAVDELVGAVAAFLVALAGLDVAPAGVLVAAVGGGISAVGGVIPLGGTVVAVVGRTPWDALVDPVGPGRLETAQQLVEPRLLAELQAGRPASTVPRALR